MVQLLILLFGIMFLMALLQTVIGKILFIGLVIFLVIKFIKFVKRDYKYWFDITKSAIFKAIGVALVVLFFRFVFFSYSTIFQKILLYIIGAIAVLWQLVNKNYSYDKEFDIKQKNKEELEKEQQIRIKKMQENGTIKEWEEEQQKLRECYEMFLSKIKAIKNGSSDIDENFINKYLYLEGYTYINSYKREKCEIKDSSLKLDIVKYAKEYLSIAGIYRNEIGEMHGSIEEARLSLPVKIIQSKHPYYAKFIDDRARGGLHYKILDNETYFLGPASINILCEEWEFYQKEAVIIQDGRIVDNSILKKPIDETSSEHRYIYNGSDYYFFDRTD